MPSPIEGEVLVQVGAVGINNTDLWTREGAYGAPDNPGAVSGWLRDAGMAFPRIQGADIAGRIVGVGSGVPEARLGERIIVNPTLYRADGEINGFIGSERDGGFAQFVAVPAENAHQIESALSDAELATFPTAYLTAEGMLERAGLIAGELVLITGASGGVGSALVQLAQARGAGVAAVVGDRKSRKLHELGVAAVIPRQVPDLGIAIQEALGDRPIDLIADVVGGWMFPFLLNALRNGGRYVTAGAIAGPVVDLDLRTLYLKNLRLIGSTLGTQDEFAGLVHKIEQGAVRPLLAATYPLEAIHAAQEAFREKQFFGKLVLVP